MTANKNNYLAHFLSQLYSLWNTHANNTAGQNTLNQIFSNNVFFSHLLKIKQ